MRNFTILIFLLCTFLANAQPRVVKPISPSNNLINLNNTTLFYLSTDSLWKTDGTNSSFVKTGLKSPQNFKAVGNNLFYVNNFKEFWVYNNSTNTFTQLKTFNSINYLTVLNSILYFAGEDAVSGKELWRTDGTISGTFMVKDINMGANSSSIGPTTTIFNGKVYFFANDGTGYKLWKTDGTETGTQSIATPPPSLSGFISTQDFIYFLTAESPYSKLYVSNGVDANIVLVKEFNTDICGDCDPPDILDVHNLMTLGNHALLAIRMKYGSELIIKSDGTSAGTTMATSVSGEIYEMKKIGDKLIYTGVNQGPNQFFGTIDEITFKATDLYYSGFYVQKFVWDLVVVDSKIVLGDDFDDGLVNFEACYFDMQTEQLTYFRNMDPSKGYTFTTLTDNFNYTPVGSNLYFIHNGKLWILEFDDVGTTSIINNDKNSGISLYPNPFEDVIKIESAISLDYSTIEIVDLLGHSYGKSQSQNNTIDVSSFHLPKGIYLLKIKDQNSNEQILRVVKK